MEDTNASWVQKALQAVTTISTSYFDSQSAKEQAKIAESLKEGQDGIGGSFFNEVTTKNALVFMGGSLGLVLMFIVLKKVLK